MNLCKLITTTTIKLPSQSNYINKLLSVKLLSLKYSTTANTTTSNDLIFSKKRSDVTKSNEKADNISRAMQYYLDKLTERGMMPVLNIKKSR